VYSGKLVAPYEAFYAGLGDQKIVTTLCPGGKERMRRLMSMIENRRVDLRPLVTHTFALDDINEAFDLFKVQDLAALHKMHARLRHAVKAADVAPVGDTDAQVIVHTPEGIQ